MEKNLQSLKSNPIFQLSLASKELFHSNFLFWLSQDEKLKGLFKEIINFLCGEKNEIDWNNLGDYVVLREYKNFDLCICKKKEIKANTQEEQPENANPDSTQNSDETFKEDEKKAGEIVFVLENKFKSIATTAQLDGYTNKVLGINLTYYKSAVCKKWNTTKWDDSTLTDKRGELVKYFNKHKPKLVLLTLAEDFTEMDSINKLKDKGYILDPNGQYLNNKITSAGYVWRIVNYSDYATKLKELIYNIEPNFSFQLINHYCEFIQTFSNYINSKLNLIDNKDGIITWNQLYKDSDFKSIRCSDIWQKMAMHKIAQELKTNISNMLKDYYIPGMDIDMDSTDKHILELGNPSNRIYIGVQYFHSLALLEIKYRIDDNCMFCIQQQGNSLCVGIVIMKDRNKIITNPKGNKEKWQETVNKYWKSCKIEEICKIKERCDKNEICDKNESCKMMKRRKIMNRFNTSGEIHAYESKDKNDGFYYKKIIFNKESNDNKEPTIEDTLNYMVEYLNRAVQNYPKEKQR